ncbi:MAG: ZIP family metal transporter, partial [Planctomycetales bacterium]|nr:ZIP family metal transporter [Planctomycetales bacterium]
MTAAGAALVFFARRMNRRLLDGMLGFSGGVMLAASYWSLLAPAIEIAEQGTLPVWLPPAIGFLLGGAVLFVLDKSLPHLHLGFDISEAEGPKSTWQRSVLLVSAITLHNIPEGLAVGVAFGGALAGLESAGVMGAVVLAVGIGIQNFPEGVAVAMPLRGEGMSRCKSFWYGQLSAVVEPIAAMLGAFAVSLAAPLLPYALSFAAGAMV